MSATSTAGRDNGRASAGHVGHKACRDNRSVLYQRVPKLFTALARGDGRYARICAALPASSS